MAHLQDLSHSSPRSLDDMAFAYADADISAISAMLQVPWAVDKGSLFAYCATYLGFYWDLRSYCVGIPMEKKDKYYTTITSSCQRKTHTLEQVQGLYGKLLHCTHVVPFGRLYLTGLERTMALLVTKSFRTIHPTRGVDGNLGWWFEQLQRPCIKCPLLSIGNVLDIGAFSDASSGIGVGIIVAGSYRVGRGSWF